MKKILVTGARFTGAVVVVYGEAGIGAEAEPPLLNVDMQGAVLDDTQKSYVLSCVPVRYGSGYDQNWGPMTGKVKIVTEDYDVDFEKDFFKPFGNAINKARCLKIWERMTRDKRPLAVSGMLAYLRHLGRNQWKNKMLPETFLKNCCWETDWDNV